MPSKGTKAYERANQRDRELIKLSCIDCNNEFTLSYGRYRKIKDGNYRCKSCMNIARGLKIKNIQANKPPEEEEKRKAGLKKYWKDPNNRKKKSEQMKEYIGEMTPEEKANWIRGMREYSEALTPYERAKWMIDWYNNLSKEDKKAFDDRRISWRYNLTPEEEIELNKRYSEAQTLVWANMIEKERIERGIKISEGKLNIPQELKDERRRQNQERYNDLPEKEKERRKSMMIDWWDNLTDEEYIEQCRKTSEGYHNLSEQDKERLRNQRKEYFKNMSEEEKYLFRHKISEGKKNMSKIAKDHQNILLKNNWENLSDEEKDLWMFHNLTSRIQNTEYTSTELEFVNILNLNKINYEFQWINNIKHPNFDELFPNNPIKNNNYVSPYHLWDFRLNLKQKSILVDIDGSRHNSERNNYIVTVNNNKILLKDHIAFNDSKRPYQTDGLDAYIIKCYNDIINDNTIVYSIKDNKDILFKDFILYLNGLNMNDKEIKEMIKQV